MRIAILGKGGSGKTTISAAFVSHIAKQQEVLLIDADVNANQSELLDMPKAKHIGDDFTIVAKVLKGTRTDLQDTPMIGTTPPATNSILLSFADIKKYFSEYISSKENLHLISVGSYEQKDIGSTCYHGKLDSIQSLLHHTLDTKEDMIIMDATAGIDILGTSLCIAFDYMVLIVEPTQKSIAMAKQYFETNPLDNERIIVVANKIEHEDDVSFITKELQAPQVIIKKSHYIKQFEQGNSTAFDLFVEEQKESFEKLLSLCNSQRDKKEYYQKLCGIHKIHAKSWYDSYYQKNVSEGFDQSLSFLENPKPLGKDAKN